MIRVISLEVLTIEHVKLIRSGQEFSQTVLVSWQQLPFKETPLCLLSYVVIYCPTLDVPQHGEKVGSSTECLETVSFDCLPGYRLKGPASRTCQEDGRWSGEQPTCDGESDIASYCHRQTLFFVQSLIVRSCLLLKMVL